MRIRIPSIRKVNVLSLFQNYFWIMCISQIISIFTNKNWLFTFFTPILIYSLSFLLIRKTKFKGFYNFLFLCVFLFPIISWIFNSYPHKSLFIIRYWLAQGAYMMTYVIGRTLPVKTSYEIFRKALVPGFICAILGFVFYVVQPQWYMAQLSNPFSLEALRLRSIFSSPYVCSYLSFFMISFLLANDFKLIPDYYIRIKTNVRIVLYITFIVLLLFCMMRAPIAGCIITLGLSALYTAVIRKDFKALIYTVFASIVLSALMLFALNTYMDEDSREFLADKFEQVTDDDSDFVSKRSTLYEANETLIGDGAGRHALYVDDYGGQAIADTCYQRLLQEVGWIGLSFHMILFISVIVKCLIHYKYLTFELAVMLFLMVSMIGADPLATPDKHCLFYWLIMGRVAGFKKKDVIIR